MEKIVIYTWTFTEENMTEFKNSLNIDILDQILQELSPKLAYQKFNSLLNSAFDTAFHY